MLTTRPTHHIIHEHVQNSLVDPAVAVEEAHAAHSGPVLGYTNFLQVHPAAGSQGGLEAAAQVLS